MPQNHVVHPRHPFRTKTGGPTWAADAADTLNPALDQLSGHALDRFIRSCFLAIRMTRQRLKSAIKRVVGGVFKFSTALPTICIFRR